MEAIDWSLSWRTAVPQSTWPFWSCWAAWHTFPFQISRPCGEPDTHLSCQIQRASWACKLHRPGTILFKTSSLLPVCIPSLGRTSHPGHKSQPDIVDDDLHVWILRRGRGWQGNIKRYIQPWVIFAGIMVSYIGLKLQGDLIATCAMACGCSILPDLFILSHAVLRTDSVCRLYWNQWATGEKTTHSSTLPTTGPHRLGKALMQVLYPATFFKTTERFPQVLSLDKHIHCSNVFL